MHEPGFPPGVHLTGGPNSAPVHAEMADAFCAPIIPIVLELRRQGFSLRAIARELDQRGIRTRVGCYYACTSNWSNAKPRIVRWNAAQVRRVLIRSSNQAIELWIDEQVRGPYTKAQVKIMLNAHMVTRETLFICPGMAEWLPLQCLIDSPDGGRRPPVYAPADGSASERGRFSDKTNPLRGCLHGGVSQEMRSSPVKRNFCTVWTQPLVMKQFVVRLTARL